ncbi:MAG: oxygen-independent coproporphyrinogen III oxidase [Caulobacter sp.]|nr:oxygen-independent coproporphyrinogen III oxidase [Caulobacter sp.]
MPSPLPKTPNRPSRDELIARYDGRAPRYTSYPTAVQFSGAVDAATHAGWLADLSPDQAVSLYLHIPFCARLCWYCGCNTRATTRTEPVAEYVDRLIDELALVEAALPGRLRTRDIHLGGGTPNMLSREDLGRLFQAIRHVFRVSPGAMVAAELDPAVLTRDWVQAAAFHGLSRASVGVQDLSPRVQAAVNRIEPFEVIERAVGWLREAGVLSVNLDLMYGLPRQTVADVNNTLDAVLTLKPERLAFFGYAHVPWMKTNQQLIKDSELPGPSERLDQSEAAAERLAREGYVRIGLDHYALPDDELARALAEQRLHRNFQGYTTDANAVLIGVGSSSISRLPQGFVQNHGLERNWRDEILRGHLPAARGVALTDEDRFRGDIIESLMCDLAVDIDAIRASHSHIIGAGPDLTGAFAHLAPFVQDGLLTVEGAKLVVTEAGRPLVRSMAAVFDAYLDPDAGRHSRSL